MSNILALDTASRISSLALLVEGQEPVYREFDSGQTCEQLFSVMSEVLGQGCMSFDSLDAFGVSTGPGSFTGIRSGIAVAQGLSLGRDIRVFGVPALMSCVPLATSQPKAFLVCRTSIRDEVFAQFIGLKPSGDGESIEIIGLSEVFTRSRDDLGLELERRNLSADDMIELESAEEPREAIRIASLVRRLMSQELGAEPFEGLEPLYVKPVNAKTLAERSNG